MPHSQRLERLDGIRFVAALLVFIAHFTEFQRYYNLPFNHYNEALVLQLGAIGVTIFFVLSGFLISLLLMHELEAPPAHWLRKFYIRRALRIWPLYFFIVALSFLFLNKIPFFKIPDYDLDYTPYLQSIVLFYIVLLPQIPYVLFPNVPYANVLWSIGVEELFYLFWPLLLRKKIKIVPVAGSLLAAWIILKIAIIVLHRENTVSQSQAEIILAFLERNRFYCFAVGGLAAYVYRNPLLSASRFLKRESVQFAAVLFLALWLSPLVAAPMLRVFMNEAVSVATAVIVLGCAWEVRLYNVLKLSAIRYLGRISYGLYCFQVIVIVAVFKTIGNGTIRLLSSVAVFALTLLLTVAVASLSFHLFEQRFLKLKDRYY